jgi:hypothetical protein
MLQHNLARKYFSINGGRWYRKAILTALSAIIRLLQILLEVRHIDDLALVKVLERAGEGEGVVVGTSAPSRVSAAVAGVGGVAAGWVVVGFAVEGDLGLLGGAGGGGGGVGQGEKHRQDLWGMHCEGGYLRFMEWGWLDWRWLS